LKKSKKKNQIKNIEEEKTFLANTHNTKLSTLNSEMKLSAREAEKIENVFFKKRKLFGEK
jgi:hypothetical protein